MLVLNDPPDGFIASCKEETDELKKKIFAAQAILNDVTMTRELALKISGVCALVNADGLRGDIVVTRAAKALVAYEAGASTRLFLSSSCAVLVTETTDDKGIEALRISTNVDYW